MSYWDTSALAKLYVSEPDNAVFEPDAAATSRRIVSATTRLELRTVPRRREAEGSIAKGTAQVLHDAFCILIEKRNFIEHPHSP